MDPPPSASANTGDVWPPPPTTPINDDRNRLRELQTQYRSVAGLTYWIVGFQGILIVLEMVTLAWEVAPHALSFVRDFSNFTAILAIIQNVLFFIWIYRLYKNAASLGAPEIHSTPGYAVACFFIPIINFFKPYQMLREVWKSTAPETDRSDVYRELTASIVTPVLGY